MISFIYFFTEERKYSLKSFKIFYMKDKGVRSGKSLNFFFFFVNLEHKNNKIFSFDFFSTWAVVLFSLYVNQIVS